MEVEINNSIPFLGMLITKVDGKLETQVYGTPADNELLLHFQSHVDSKSKKCLVNTVVDRAYRLSSSAEGFSIECEKLRRMFSKPFYPIALVELTIRRFSQDQTKNKAPLTAYENKPSPAHLNIQYGDQTTADRIRRDLNSLNCKNNVNVKALFASNKLGEILSTG